MIMLEKNEAILSLGKLISLYMQQKKNNFTVN